MMEAENIESLELDKRTNTLCIKKESVEREVGLTMDLVTEFVRLAEEDSSEVFKVIQDHRIEDVHLIVEQNVDVSQLLADLESVEGVEFGGRTRDSVKGYKKGL